MPIILAVAAILIWILLMKNLGTEDRLRNDADFRREWLRKRGLLAPKAPKAPKAPIAPVPPPHR